VVLAELNLCVLIHGFYDGSVRTTQQAITIRRKCFFHVVTYGLTVINERDTFYMLKVVLPPPQ
jgi:hypothetical protein